MAGISKMQSDYWTNKAQIPTKGRKQRDLRQRRGRDRDADQAYNQLTLRRIDAA